MPDPGEWVEFVLTPLFERSARRLIDEEGLRAIEALLLEHPRAGDIVPGTGGVRKLRVALPFQGKRGGARVLYLHAEAQQTIYLLLAYSKAQQLDLTPVEKILLQRMARKLKEGG